MGVRDESESAIRRIVNDLLVGLDADFAALYEPTGRDSTAPKRLLRGSLLQMFFSIRSERQLMEQMDTAEREAAKYLVNDHA